MLTGQNITRHRADFPALRHLMNGKPLAYLDSGASAQKPRVVIDAMTAVYETEYANIHRGLYAISQNVTQKFEAVREKVARFIGAPRTEEIVFTRNTTEAINLVATCWGGSVFAEGDEIILSTMEHHANIVPWQLLRDRMGVVIRTIPLNADGTLDMAAFKALLSPRTRMVAVTHISNALGIVNDVKEISAIAHGFDSRIKVLVDGSQSVVHRAVDVAALGCDFFVFTGHKLYGPTGIGVLWGRYELLEAMPPYQGGGDMIDTVTFEKTTFKAPPARFEAGTPAIAEVIGLGAAIDYVSAVGMDNIAAHEGRLLAAAIERLAGVDGLTFYGTGPEKAGIVSFTAAWAHTSDIAMVLDQCGVAVRTGHHCCMPLMRYYGIEGTVRASFGLYTNLDDIEALTGGLKKAKELLA
jgi:cysteine desulfurase/selenocysteine lyase